MSRTNYEKERIRKAAQFEQDFAKRVATVRGDLYKEVLAYLSANISADKNGRVLFSVSNIRSSTGIIGAIQAFAKKTGTKLIRWLIVKLSDLFKINTYYFRSFLDYPETRDERAIRKLMLQLGYDISTNKVLKGGFFSRVFQLDGVASSIARDIQQALSSNLTMAAFKQAFRDRFVSAKYVDRWFNQFTRDLFHQFDRSTQLVLAQDLNLVHFTWAGVNDLKTTCFCERRVNRVFTIEFAEKWDLELKWKGKKPNNNFFIDGHGYNCRKHASFITKSRAERVTNQRGYQINTYNETECNDEKEE